MDFSAFAPAFVEPTSHVFAASRRSVRKASQAPQAPHHGTHQRRTISGVFSIPAYGSDGQLRQTNTVGVQHPVAKVAVRGASPEEQIRPESARRGDTAENSSSSSEATERETNEDSLVSAAQSKGIDGQPLSEFELQLIEELKARDREVRAHEMAHKAVGGRYAGAISYDYQRGPDGRRYAVGGEVSIDISEIPGNPDATVAKMQQVRRAALAPAAPSAQDRRVAAEASRKENKARIDALKQSMDEQKSGVTSSEEAKDTLQIGEGEPQGSNPRSSVDNRDESDVPRLSHESATDAYRQTYGLKAYRAA